MPRPLRSYRPGDLLHVVNHGQAHAPVFETAADVDRLLSVLGWAVVEGWIRVLAFSLLATHYHLIVETLDARLDVAMQRLQAAFAMWRNRTRARVGHVFKGRYFARHVRGGIDLACTLDYLDRNPVEADIVTTPEAYPHGSARAYVMGGGPGWLYRDTIETLICRLTGAPRYSGADYPRLWMWARRSGVRELTRRRGTTAFADVPVLSRAGPAHVQAWLREHLEREEGRSEPCVVLPGAEILRQRGLGEGRGDDVLFAGLLSQVAGWSVTEIAQALGVSRASAARMAAEHRRRLREDDAHGACCAEVVRAGVREVFGALEGAGRETDGV